MEIKQRAIAVCPNCGNRATHKLVYSHRAYEPWEIGETRGRS